MKPSFLLVLLLLFSYVCCYQEFLSEKDGFININDNNHSDVLFEGWFRLSDLELNVR